MSLSVQESIVRIEESTSYRISDEELKILYEVRDAQIDIVDVAVCRIIYFLDLPDSKKEMFPECSNDYMFCFFQEKPYPIDIFSVPKGSPFDGIYEDGKMATIFLEYGGDCVMMFEIEK